MEKEVIWSSKFLGVSRAVRLIVFALYQRNGDQRSVGNAAIHKVTTQAVRGSRMRSRLGGICNLLNLSGCGTLELVRRMEPCNPAVGVV